MLAYLHYLATPQGRIRVTPEAERDGKEEAVGLTNELAFYAAGGTVEAAGIVEEVIAGFAVEVKGFAVDVIVLAA